jgi:hypothetical protein
MTESCRPSGDVPGKAAKGGVRVDLPITHVYPGGNEAG